MRTIFPLFPFICLCSKVAGYSFCGIPTAANSEVAERPLVDSHSMIEECFFPPLLYFLNFVLIE